MLKFLPQNESQLRVDNLEPKAIVGYINGYISKYSCENMSVDISFMNVLDACYVTTLCSAQHFIKYPNGKINWKVSSGIIKDLNKDFELGNNNYMFE